MKNIWKISGALSVVAVGLAGCGGGSNNNNGGAGQTFTQQERLARPVVNEVLATVAERRHRVNNTDNPTDDGLELKKDIQSFMKFPAGRSNDTINAVTSVLIPDVMTADLSQTGEAAYLGLETGGATSATKSTFGGRKLTDDVVDTSLGVIFGSTVSDLKLAPDDKKEIPTLTSDNVDSSGHNYSSSFPYLQAPR